MFKSIVFAFLIVSLGFVADVQSQNLSDEFKEESNIYEKVYDAPLKIEDEELDFSQKVFARKAHKFIEVKQKELIELHLLKIRN